MCEGINLLFILCLYLSGLSFNPAVVATPQAIIKLMVAQLQIAIIETITRSETITARAHRQRERMKKMALSPGWREGEMRTREHRMVSGGEGVVRRLIRVDRGKYLNQWGKD